MEQVGLQCDTSCSLIGVWARHEAPPPPLNLSWLSYFLSSSCSHCVAQLSPRKCILKKIQISFNLLSQFYTVLWQSKVCTLSLYSSFIMQQLKKVGGSCGGILRTLVVVWLVSAGTGSPVPNRMSFVCTFLFAWATKVCFSHRKNLGVTVCAESLSTSTETPIASPAYVQGKAHCLYLS